MLPFLKPKKSSGVIIAKTKEDGSIEQGPMDDDSDHAMEAAAEDILRAIASKDAAHLAMALRSAFEILDSQEHVEGPHEENQGE